MLPKITDGSYVLVKKNSTINLSIKKNTIMIIYHKIYGNLIKKFDYIDKTNNFWFKGISNESISGDEIGPISRENILGKVIFVLNKKS